MHLRDDHGSLPDGSRGKDKGSAGCRTEHVMLVWGKVELLLTLTRTVLLVKVSKEERQQQLQLGCHPSPTLHPMTSMCGWERKWTKLSARKLLGDENETHVRTFVSTTPLPPRKCLVGNTNPLRRCASLVYLTMECSG